MTTLRLALATTLLAALAACSSTHPSGDSAATTQLVGTFHLAAGSCSATSRSGTYFRMIQPGGTIDKGKFFSNPDSTCPDKSFTVQHAGTDGGLVTGRYQPAPAKAFDATGDALSARITQPGSFTAIKFGISTSDIDPQTKRKVAAPSISVDKAGRLSGQVTAWSAAWNNLYFNQGSPKPDGSRPGLTAPVGGTYDASTHRFVLTWASEVVGGPFNGFTGYWHLQGTFTPTA
ncbi:MAG: hypothetical protein QOG80_794 [Pseudonocardiales bacterium]|jgi:hypothetical protein|nr:hypothetical protein [Pseudonocardiales bacterium]